MRVLLIQSYLGRREKPILPLGLAYLANSLNGHEVSILDPNIEDDPYGAMRKRIADFKPEVVGLSLRNIDTTSYKDIYYHYQTIGPTVELIKEAAPSSYVVIGGAAFSLFAEDVMDRNPGIDFGVYLEGEKTFPELLDHLSYPQEVPGVYYRENGKVIFTGPRPLPELENISPHLDLLEVARYRNHEEGIGVQSKRGCLLNCAYCTYPFLTGRTVRLRPAMKVVNEIEQNIEKHGVTQFIFADTIFNIPKDHAVAICKEMIRRGLKVRWTAFFNLKGVDEDFLRLACSAGCYLFIFSPDAYSDKALRMLHKGIQKKDIQRVYDLAKKFKASRFDFSFFINAPGQNYGDLTALLWLLVKTNFLLSQKKFMHISINIPRLEPHTELYKLAVREGTLSQTESLLPREAALLRSLYYHNPHARLAESVFSFLVTSKRMLNHLTGKG